MGNIGSLMIAEAAEAKSKEEPFTSPSSLCKRGKWGSGSPYSRKPKSLSLKRGYE